MTAIENPNQEIINIDYIIAVGISVMILVIFISLFNIDFGVKSVNGAINNPLSEITMLPIEKNPRYNWQKSLITTIELLDPTIMSLPSTDFGFSQVRNFEFAKKVESVSPVEFKINLTTGNTDMAVYIDKSPKQLHSVLSSSYSQQSIGIDVVEKEMPKIESQIYWTNRDGSIISSLTQSFPEVKKILNETSKISGPTVILVAHEKTIIRTQILKSCGNFKFDQIALRHINSNKIKFQSQGNPNNIQLKSMEQLRLSAHWRFLPEADFSETIKLEESINVQDWY